jgi:hypothetical protein
LNQCIAITLTFFGEVWEATFAIGKYTCMQGWFTHLLYSDDMTNKTIKDSSGEDVGDDRSILIDITYATNIELKPEIGDSLSVHNVCEGSKVRVEDS